MALSQINSASIENASVAIADLSATGTPSSSTFFRGDNTWSTPTNGLGDGQTWQTVTGSRAASTVYTNTTGRPIFVSVGCQNSGGAVFQVNGIQVFQGASTTSVTAGGVCGIVPAGGTYSFSGTIYAFWAELR